MDLAAWILEHGTTLVALAVSLTTLARSRATREEAAAAAVTAVVEELGERKQAHEACEARCTSLEARMAAAESAARAADGRARAAVDELRRHLGRKE